MFTKTQYEWLINFSAEYLTASQWEQLADRLKDADPNFDWHEFYDSCEKAACESPKRSDDLSTLPSKTYTPKFG